MNTSMKILAGVLAVSLLVGCSAGEREGHTVDASGKEAAALDTLPDEVVAAALAARPELSITAAEYETRDGDEYYDVGGVLPDGSELELDMTRVNGVWTVVEFQRDIGMGQVPEPVAAALEDGVAGWSPVRIIESDQGDGTIIYEFFGSEQPPVKHEVMWTGGKAELLVDEWKH